MADPIRIGIVGCGSVMGGPYTSLIESLRLRNMVEVTIACDEKEEKRDFVRQKLGLERFTTNYEEVVDADDVDLVLVLTSMLEHAPIASAALQAGKHVLVEKPMGTTLAEAAERFTKALAASGWKLEEGGIRAEDYTLLNFTKDEKEIALRARSKVGNADVSFQGDGLLWTKELPTGKQIVAFETWLRLNKLPATLDLLDRYEAEMRKIASGGETTP